MTGNFLRIGSRASPLARVQAEWVAERVGCCTAMVWVRSEGDQDRATPLHAFGNTGIFTDVLNRALREDRVDAAVHSLKDLPAVDESGLTIGCVPVREDPRDALITKGDIGLEHLPKGARVGTGSPRRIAQLRRVRPDLTFDIIRGNVGTRMQKVADGEIDAVVLALAGLRRLGFDGNVSEILEPEVCLPAAGQGALGIVIREGDAKAQECLAEMKDDGAAACTSAERTALHELGAGCHAPVCAHAVLDGGELHLRVRVCSLDGTQTLEHAAHGPIAEAAEIGRGTAAELLEQGAGPLVSA